MANKLVGIALVILSVAVLLTSIKVVVLTVQFKQLKASYIENLKTDRLTADNFVSNVELQKTIYNRIDNIENKSPMNCLKEHKRLYKEYLDALLMINQLKERVDYLEYKLLLNKGSYNEK